MKSKIKKYKEELREQTESKLFSLVQYSADGIIGTNLDGIIYSWNPGAERIYGYPEKEVVGKSIAILIPDERKHEVKEIIDKVKRGERVEQYETIRIRKDGRRIHVSVDISFVKDSLGKVISISAVVHDITERKLAEKVLLEAQRQLATLIDNLPGIAYRCANDTNWTMEYLSEGCLELTGYTSDELIGNKLISYNSLIHVKDQQKVWDAVQEAVSRKQPYIIEYRIITKDRKEKYVWEKGTGIFSKTGSLLALEGFISDISELKKLQTKLEETKLKERNEREITSIEELGNSNSKDDVTVQLFCLLPLSKSRPGIFNDLLDRYINILHTETGLKNSKLDFMVLDELHFMAKQLCTLNASHNDVIELHSRAIKKIGENTTVSQTEAYTEIGRLMMLELMCQLVYYYRRDFLKEGLTSKLLINKS